MAHYHKAAGTPAGFLGAGVAGVKKLAGMGGHAAAPPRRRQKRIVISEKQWEFIRTLINSVTHRGSMPHFRKRRHKKHFF